MMITRRPMLTTIFFGLVCGIFFIPISTVLNYFISWHVAFQLTIWGYLALYGVLLTRWGKVRPLSIVFPLLLLFTFVFLEDLPTGFLLLALVILSWIRSGICFKGAGFKMVGVELLICFGGGALVTYFTPHSIVMWAMGVWLFFLVQSLFFVFYGTINEKEIEERAQDNFEGLRRRAEKILLSEFHCEI